jgi:hypothetical protein
MNAIFAVAFFAACVAAQTFDTTTTTDLNRLLLKSRLNNKFDQMSVSDLFRTSGLYGKHYGTGYGYGLKNLDSIVDRVATPWVLPRSYYNNQQYQYSNVVDQHQIYTLDEIVRHPLFRQYLALPLFRQHLSHPLFQYYLTTPLFQQYWTVPQFQTFFQNPYLFYKYVYPVVYNTESTIFDQVKTDSVYPYGSRYSNIDSVVDVDPTRVLDNGVFDREVPVSQYSQYFPRTHQRTSSGIYGLDTLLNKYNQYPSIYNQGQQYGSIFRHHLPYTYVMDKIFKSYFINKPQITEVVTDVKVQDNNVDEQTYGKIIDPITGEVKYTNGDFKVVDEKIVPVVGGRVVDTDYSVVDQLIGGGRKHFNVKDALVKRMYLNKILNGDRKFEELYPEYSTETNIPILAKIQKLNKLSRFENILEGNKLVGDVNIDEMIRTPVTTDSDLLLRPYLTNKGLTRDLLSRVQLTKDNIKDFTLTGKYDMPIEFTKNFDKPTTKTVIV